MKLVLPLDGLDQHTRAAFEALQAQMAEQWQVANTSEGQSKRTIVSVFHNTTQNHTSSGSFVAVNFNAEDDLRSLATITVPANIHNTTTRPDRVMVPGNPGGPLVWCHVRAKVTFAANATGDRGLRIMLNDAVVRRPVHTRSATVTTAARVTAVASFPASPGDAIHIEAFQDSGGTLALGSTSRADANECEVEFC